MTSVATGLDLLVDKKAEIERIVRKKAKFKEQPKPEQVVLTNLASRSRSRSRSKEDGDKMIQTLSIK